MKRSSKIAPLTLHPIPPISLSKNKWRPIPFSLWLVPIRQIKPNVLLSLSFFYPPLSSSIVYHSNVHLFCYYFFYIFGLNVMISFPFSIFPCFCFLPPFFFSPFSFLPFTRLYFMYFSYHLLYSFFLSHFCIFPFAFQIFLLCSLPSLLFLSFESSLIHVSLYLFFPFFLFFLLLSSCFPFRCSFVVFLSIPNERQ